MSKGWQRDKSGRVIFYYYRDGKQMKVPRSETRWLDNQPEHNIIFERERWAAVHLKERQQFKSLTHTDTLALVERFLEFAVSRGKDTTTIANYKLFLTRYTLPFFVQKEGLTAPADWPKKSIRLLYHLQTFNLSPSSINSITIVMRVFWKWLLEERLTEGSLMLRAAINNNLTPLNFTVTPQQVLKYSYKTPEARLLALIGFFFSLRPQELMALRPADFRTGTTAAALECCKAMEAANHFNRFAVNVHRQRKGQTFKSPKVSSGGWVACFDSQAAREIVGLIKDLDRESLIFPAGSRWIYKTWRRDGYSGLSLKDLRRASIYWLGHYGKLDFTVLKNHARHRDPSTTALYIRRPDEGEVETSAWDLDA